MPANVYEGLFILDSNRYGRDPSVATKQIPSGIEASGGEMLVSRLWEERRLAYQINGQRKGTYWLTYFRIDSQKLIELNRKFQINDDVLRHLFVKIEPRLVDAMVEHAKTGGVKKEPPKTAKSKGTEKETAAVAETATVEGATPEASNGEDSKPEAGKPEESSPEKGDKPEEGDQ